MTSTKLDFEGYELKPGVWILTIETPSVQAPPVVLNIESIDQNRITGVIAIDNIPFPLDLNFVEGDNVTFRAENYPGNNPLLYLFVGSLSQGQGKVLFQIDPPDTHIYAETGLEGSWVAGPKPEPEDE